MVRFFQVELQGPCKAYLGLSKVFGIGSSYSLYLCYKIGFNKTSLCSELTRDHLNMLTRLTLQNRVIGMELQRFSAKPIESAIRLRCYRGLRFIEQLPVNGQNTKNNRKTARKLNILKKL